MKGIEGYLSDAGKEKVTDRGIGLLADAIERRADEGAELPFGDPKDLASAVIIAAMVWDTTEPAEWEERAAEVFESTVESGAPTDEIMAAVQSPALWDFVLFFADEGPMPDPFWEAKAGTPPMMELSFAQLSALIDQTIPADQTVEDEIERLREESDVIDVLGVDKEKETVAVQLNEEVEADMATAVAQHVAGASTELEAPDTLPVESDLDFETAILYAKSAGADRVVNQLDMMRSTFVPNPSRGAIALRKHLTNQIDYPIMRRLKGEPSAQERAS